MEHKIDELLKRSCHVIDFLPQRVSKTANGQYFDVEHYMLNSDRYQGLKDRFVNIILKMMCYYHSLVLWDEWIDRPNPNLIDNAVNEIMNNHSGTLNVLFPDEDVLLVFEWDCLNLTVYNLPENMMEIIEKIALSEGFFLWESED